MKKNPVVIVFVTAAVLGVVFYVVLFAASALSGRKASSSIIGSDRVAVVKLEGMLLSSEEFIEEFKGFSEDASIRAIVIRIDSPGGGVVPSQEIYNAVKAARKEGKKIVASMGSVAASGGYYVAAATDSIIASPGTITGSIGVKMEFANIEKLLEKIGVKGMVVKSGQFKDIGSPYRESTEQEKNLLQSVIDDVHAQFMEAVAEGRNLPLDDVRAVADGRIFTGRQALALKLVDRLGDLDDGIQAAATLAGIKGKPTVVRKEKKIRLFDYLKQESASWIIGVINKGLSETSGQLNYLYQ
jgi:protease IV